MRLLQGMKECVEQFRGRPEHQAADSCAVCLLSHGVEGAVYGTDGQLLEVSRITTRNVKSLCRQEAAEL